MDLRELTQRYGVRLMVIALCGAVGAVAALLTSTQLPTLYEARATLIAQTMGSTHAEVAVSQPVLAHAIAALRLPLKPEELRQNLDARASQTSAILTVVARDADPDRAAAIASTIASRVVELAPVVTGSSAEAQETIQADLGRVQTEIDQTESAIEELSALPALTPSEQQQHQALHDRLASLLAVRAGLQSAAIASAATVVTLLAPAAPPTDPSSPNILLLTAVGGLAGLSIGVGVTLATASLRSREVPGAPRVAPGGRVTRLAQQQQWSGVPPNRSDR